MVASTGRDPHAYLKWPRLIAFNINGALAITATALSSRSLVNLNHDRKMLAAALPGTTLQAGDVVAASAVFVSAAGICSLYTAALSTVITLRLHREETKRTIFVKECIMGFMALFLLGAAIAGTIIVIPRSAGVRGPLPSTLIIRAIQAQGKSLRYRDALVFPALIVTWVTFGCTLVCFVLAALASRHIAKYGPENTLIGHAVSDKVENGGGFVKHGEKPQHSEHVHE